MSGPATILVVDDEPRNVKLLEALLVPERYRVVSANDGERALAIIDEQPIDLVLLDVMMPSLDGFELTRRLRQQPRGRLLPIVLVTALKETDDRIRGIEAGCDDFISKPFDRHEVLARVKTLLTLSYYRAQLDERDKFAYVMDHIEDGIVVLGPDLRMTRINDRAGHLLAIDPASTSEELVPHFVTRFTVHYDGDLSAALLAQPLAFDLERRETETTRSLILNVRSSVVKDPAGGVGSVVLTIHDVTAERQEEFLKQDFLSLISHKLRTPLAIILTYASMLQEGVLGAMTDQQRQAVEAILDKSHALKSLIEKLLVFTTIRSQAPGQPQRPLILHQELPAMIDGLVKRLAASRPVECRLAAVDPTAAVAMSARYLELILGNLLENAVKFNDKDRPTVSIAVTRADGQVALSVTDNGRGIPQEEQQKIFDTFYQVEKYFTGNVEGAGLGLALVKHVVIAHGGRIRLQSELGQGARFTVLLPQQTLDKLCATP